MNIIDQIKAKAHSNRKTIVFPEGDEPRTLQAAAVLRDEQLVNPILLGDPSAIQAAAVPLHVDLGGIELVNPAESSRASDYASALFRLRQKKGLSREEASHLICDPMYFGVMMVEQGDADGLVSGACHTTGDMLRPAFQIIGTKPGISVVSGCLLVDTKNKALGRDGILLFSDCVVVPCPSALELAHIAISTADTARRLCGFEDPKVAMLSFSTKGSAKHEFVSKVQEAVSLAHELEPGLTLDGELQFDAALVPEIANLKAPGSPVAGHADVLIFPDLQSGNIGYKIAQRLGGAEAVAILQGLRKPCNDLSRGCSVEDIVMTAVITAVQSD